MSASAHTLITKGEEMITSHIINVNWLFTWLILCATKNCATWLIKFVNSITNAVSTKSWSSFRSLKTWSSPEKILSCIHSGWWWKEKLRKVSWNTSPTRNVRQTTGVLYRWKFGCHVFDCVWWLGHWAPHSYQRQGSLDDVDRRTTERIVSKAIFHSYYYPLHF